MRSYLFTAPQARANKVNKNEQDIKEFEDALEEHRAKGTEDQELSRKLAKSKKKTKAKAKARPKRKAAAQSSGSESE